MYAMYGKDRKVKMIWTGRSRGHGPEGQEVTDQKVGTGRTGRSTGIRDGSPLRHLDRKVPQSYGLERCMCCMWCFGELTKHLCLQLLCYVFQLLARIVGRRRHDPYTLMEFMS